jgi:protein-ribulosamine 3-kinase
MYLSQELKIFLKNLLNTKIISANEIGGGDISRTFMVETAKGSFFIKYHSGASAFEMFEAEKAGLAAIGKTGSIAVPEVYFVQEYKGGALLIMEYIRRKSANKVDFFKLGEQLAALHQNNSEESGFVQDNFIGSLTQSNRKHIDWVDFYVEERLQPQMEMAIGSGRTDRKKMPEAERMKEVCMNIFGNPKASLLHGDLWSGNYLISSAGVPYLIDPAVYYGDSMIDLSMSRLFGGFGESFYEAYEAIHQRAENYSAKTDIYQLYYLLVHLNLFGSSYYQSVTNIIQRYFGK